jgi:Legume lectin domain
MGATKVQKEDSMRFGTMLKTVLVSVVAVLCMAPASAQQVRYFPDFSTGTSNLQMNGSAHVATYNSAKVLRLTDGYPGVGATHPETAAAWFNIPSLPSQGQQLVNTGFFTYFKFQIHTAAICCTPGDGFAFVIQTASSTALGSGFGGIGYAGIPNSLAIEFDTFQNTWDPNANHVAVQSCGTGANAPQHVVGNCLVAGGINTNIPHLGVTCGNSSCADGVPHEVVIQYTAPVNGHGNGTLVVWIDPQFIKGTHQPVATAIKAINIPYNIDNSQNTQGISLTNGTSAWVGFTADQPNIPEAHDILAWEFTPQAATQVTQVIPPGGTEADYVFGGHHMGVTYFQGYVNESCDGTNPNDTCLMTVLATPVPPNDFYRLRLVGTQFSSEQCLTYLETGGNCIVYTVTCANQSNPKVTVPCPAADPTKCTTLGDTVNCITFNTSFYTSDPITPHNADYLKADPIGTNNWVSIFVSYDPNVFDGKTTGTGGSSSDFVATFKPGGEQKQ